MEAFRIQFAKEKDTIFLTGDKGDIKSLNTMEQKSKTILKTSTCFNSSMAISPSGKYLATGNTNGDIFIFDLGNEGKITVLKKCHQKIVRSLSFLYDSGFLLSCSDDKTIKLIDMQLMKVV